MDTSRCAWTRADPGTRGRAVRRTGLWDRTFDDAGMPAHFFWEVATVQKRLLQPPTTLDQNSPQFDHSTTASFDVGLPITGAIDHITARVRIRPFAYAVLADLVGSGDLDPMIASSIPTLDVAGAHRTWTRAAVDPISDGCDRDPYQ
jgi:hypothetical protein